jgi:hypothetical protein
MRDQLPLFYQTDFTSSATGEVIAKNKSTIPKLEIAWSTPGGRKMKSCRRTTRLAGDLHQPLAFAQVDIGGDVNVDQTRLVDGDTLSERFNDSRVAATCLRCKLL